MSDEDLPKDLIDVATAAIRLGQEDARQLARETGTRFIAEGETRATTRYPVSDVGTSASVVREESTEGK